jgi:hypothetical protein
MGCQAVTNVEMEGKRGRSGKLGEAKAHVCTELN